MGWLRAKTHAANGSGRIMVDPILLGGRRICLPAGRETGCAPERVTPVRLRQRSHGEFLWNHENRTCSPGPLSHTRCRPARPVRRHRRIRQSPAAPFCPRAYHPRAGRAPSRLMVSTKSRKGQSQGRTFGLATRLRVDGVRRGDQIAICRPISTTSSPGSLKKSLTCTAFRSIAAKRASSHLARPFPSSR